MSAISASPVKLCSQLTVDLNSEISAHNRKGTLLWVATIVAGIALAVILTSWSLIGLELMAAPPIWVLLVELLALMGATKGLDLHHQGNSEYRESAALTKIAKKLAELEKTPDLETFVKNYYKDNGLELENAKAIVNKYIAENNLTTPYYKVVLPLIAREQVLKETAGDVEDDQNIRGIKQVAKEHTQSLSKYAQDPMLKTSCIHNILKARADLAANTFERARCLQQLQTPDHQYRVITNEKDERTIYDITNLAAPVTFGRIIYPESTQELMYSYMKVPGTVKNTRDYVINGTTRLTLEDFLLDLDVQAPDSPTLVSGRTKADARSPAYIRHKIFG